MKSKGILSTQEIIILNYLKKHPNKGKTLAEIFQDLRSDSLIDVSKAKIPFDVTVQLFRNDLDSLVKASKIMKCKLKEKEIYFYIDGKTLLRP
jgi:hypothetical protein